MSIKSKKTPMTGYRSDPAPASVPWPEWSDAELNAEKWDSPKNGPDGRFVDPEPLPMPPSLQEVLHAWKRGSMLDNLSSSPVVITSGNEYPDFSKNNGHILHSEFVRWFVSTITNLRYAGRDDQRAEGESTGGWRGWMHVYSMNKASNAASQHHPVVNPNGKYVVRLYFMGFWRRFIVDDMIPVDGDGRPLLPRTENDFELWPLILAKAMMRLASLSWTNRREINDFHPVTCLTSWICLPVGTRSLSPNEKWHLLAKYIEDENCRGVPPSEPIEETAKTHGPRSKVTIFVNLTKDTAPGSYPVHIDKLRDTTRGSSPQLRWKAYRWFDWALRHGKTKAPGAGLRYLRLINPFEKVEGRELRAWEDFGDIAAFLDEIFIFYEPSDFAYRTRVSDVVRTIVSATSSRVESQLTTSKKGQATSASSVTSAPGFFTEFKWQRNVSACKNDPTLYMLVDSVDAKFFLIDFCSLPKPSPLATRSYLIVEAYNFFEKLNDDEPVASIETHSAGATVFEAGPGRRVFRILFRAGSSYSVRILSDTIFHVGDKLRIQDLMTSESDGIDAIVKNTSNRLAVAVREFGGPEFTGHLRAFYNSYMPRDEDAVRSNVDKKLIKIIHRLFIEELTKLVRGTFSTVESAAIFYSLRVFFLDPTIGISSEPNYRTAEDEVDSGKSIRGRAAVKIQSFFKMVLVKMYKRIHNQSNAKHGEVKRSLRKVVDLFNYTNRESFANSLIRKMIDIFSPLYPSCHEDLSNVLNVEEWKGVARNVQSGQWIPLFRVVVNSTSTEATVYASIDFASGPPRRTIRVVNNETYREVTRVGDVTSAVRFPYVGRGYTIIGYGWSDGSKFKEFDWSVRVTTVKGQPTFSTRTISSRPSLLVRELTNTYVPNASNVIGKWIVAVSTDCLLSFRVSTTYGTVETMMKVVDEDGKVLCEAEGGSCLVLPAVCLSFDGERRSSADIPEIRNSRSKSVSDSTGAVDEATTEYYLRVYVLNDSWPLTPAEWVVAKEAEARGTVYDPRCVVTTFSKRGARSKLQLGNGEVADTSSQTILQHPLCRLQIITDVGTKVQVVPDRRREIEVAEMKRLWEIAEPGRSLRGRGLRDGFLGENSVVVTKRKNSDTRTLKPPANLSPVLPAWNLDSYVTKDEEEEERWVKTENDEEMLRNQRKINCLEFDRMREAYVNDEAELIREQRERYSTLFDSYTKKSSYRKNLADTACELRDKYLAELSSTLSARAGKNVNDKKKNKKK